MEVSNGHCRGNCADPPSKVLEKGQQAPRSASGCEGHAISFEGRPFDETPRPAQGQGSMQPVNSQIYALDAVDARLTEPGQSVLYSGTCAEVLAQPHSHHQTVRNMSWGT